MAIIKDLFGGADRRAADARAEGIDAGIAEQRRQDTLNREDFAPSIERGDLAGEREAEFLGLRGQEAEQRAIDSFTESPGQTFLRKRAERALVRNSAATGGTGGGRVLEALNEQAIGISGQFLGERKDRLRNVAGAGQNAVTNQAGLSTGISGNIANLSVERGDVIGTGIERQAEKRLSGLRSIAGAFTGGMTGGGGGQGKFGGFKNRRLA